MRRVHPMPFGAEVIDERRAHFRLWAPDAGRVELMLGPHDVSLPMSSAGNGWHELVADATPGTRYRYRIDARLEVPDPASRHNPDDVHGASELIDPSRFEWTDGAWRGRPWHEAVIYELHVGTFSPEGTFAGIGPRLDHLVSLGITAIELMPVAEFPGRRNWGYDGVLPYAPESTYGHPDDLKRLIVAAHERGLMVFLDVVYNHFGPEGNYLHEYAKSFFTDRHHTPWGAAVNFDTGTGARVVRDFFIHNALYWLEEYHLDGLRFDAVHAIIDDSATHFLSELVARIRSAARGRGHVHLLLENDRNEAHYLRNDGTEKRYDAQWNDDFHHGAHVLLTGETGGYYADYAIRTEERLGRALAGGFSYENEYSPHRNAPRGESTAGLPPTAFIDFLQNHDQVGNRALGERLHTLTASERLRAVTAAWLLAPSIPMLFMGEEFAAASPFQFFCDFGEELAAVVREGRVTEFAGFFGGTEAAPDPVAEETCTRCRLDWESLAFEPHAGWLTLYRALLAKRHRHLVPLLSNGAPTLSAHSSPGPGVVRAWWQWPGGEMLSIVLNLSDATVHLDDPPPGQLIHWQSPEPQRERGTLPATSAACYLLTSQPYAPA